MQVSAAVDSKAASSTSVADDLLGDEAQSSTSVEDDEEGYVPPVFSPVQNAVGPLPGDFGGARPHIPSAAMGSGHRKKALPHHSTHA